MKVLSRYGDNGKIGPALAELERLSEWENLYFQRSQILRWLWFNAAINDGISIRSLPKKTKRAMNGLTLPMFWMI